MIKTARYFVPGRSPYSMNKGMAGYQAKPEWELIPPDEHIGRDSSTHTEYSISAFKDKCFFPLFLRSFFVSIFHLKREVYP